MPGVPPFRAPKAARAATSSASRFPSRRCSAMPPIFAAAPKGALRSPCTSRTTRNCRRRSRKRSSRSTAEKSSDRTGMSQENLTFEIELPGGSTNLEEWRKAQALPVSELRQLTTEEKEVARKLGITEESLARSAKADEFGKERMRRKAQEFGQRVNRIL